MNERQKNLLAKARQKLRVAEDLLQLGHCEDGVSRAYYSMFYVAEALLEGEGLRFRSHSAVIAEFGRLFAKTSRMPVEFHRAMIEAQEDRLGGDYSEDYNLSIEDARQHVENAIRMLTAGETLLGGTAEATQADGDQSSVLPPMEADD